MKITRRQLKQLIKEELSSVSEHRRKPQRTPDEELIIKMAKQMQDPDEDYDYDYHDFEEARLADDAFQAGKEMPEITHPSYYRTYKNNEELAAMERQMSREFDDQMASYTPEEIAYADANPTSTSLKQLAAKIRSVT
jgi:hypothetical protein